MDTRKISLWLFFVLSSATLSKSKSFTKYEIPNTGISNKGFGDNCFCFKTHGEYKKVPEIMNQDKDNLERIAVYFYKYKNTDEIKMYIPNREKQALIPDLAFEVGDNLNTVDEMDRVKHLFQIVSHGNGKNLHHDPPIDNTKVTQPVQDWKQEHSQSNYIPAKDINAPHSDEILFLDSSKEQTTNKDEVPNKITFVDEIDYEHGTPQNDFTEIPSSQIDNELLPNTNNIIYINEKPSDNINIIPDSSDMKSSQKNNLPVETLVTHNDDNSSEPLGKHLSKEEVTQNFELVDDHESYSKEYDKINDVSPKEEASTIGYFIDSTDMYELRKPNTSEIQSKDVSLEKPVTDPSEVNSIKQNEAGNTINANIEKKPSTTKNDSEISIDDENKHWHVEEITEPAKAAQDYNVTPQSVLDINFPNGGMTVPVIDKNNHSQIISHSNEQDTYRDTIVIGVEGHRNVPNEPVTIHSNEKDLNKVVIEVDGQNGGQWNTPHENITIYGDRPSNEYSVDLIRANNSQPDFVSIENASVEEHEPTEIPFLPNITDEDIALDSDNKYETFDIWFAQQMKRFKTYTKHDRPINLRKIEKYILKILHDNSMHVTAEGVLVDSFGTALDVQKLHLRPIFIGNTVTLRKIFNAKTSESVMPANNVFLQAILLTNSDPSLMLGIIPIGKTVLPPTKNKASSAALSPYLLHGTLRKLSHHNFPKNVHQRRYKEQIPKQKPGKKIWKGFTSVKKTPRIERLHHLYRQPVRTFKVIKTSKPDEETVLSEDSTDDKNKLIASILKGNVPITSAGVMNKLLASLRNNVVPLNTILKGSEEMDTGDLAPRIIGGNAATSSGVPLSVKGRIKDI